MVYAKGKTSEPNKGEKYIHYIGEYSNFNKYTLFINLKLSETRYVYYVRDNTTKVFSVP